ncbi:MAG: sulfatase [Gemmata sp.]
MRAIVFAISGCPAGWLGAYGNDWVGTPNLDRLAAEAVTFDRHISDNPDPSAARRAWLGGPAQPAARAEGKGQENTGEPEPAAVREGSAAAFPSAMGVSGAGLLTCLVRANHPDNDAPDWFNAGWGEVFDARPRPDDDSPLDGLLRAWPALLDRLGAATDFLVWVEIDRLIPPWDVQQDVFDAYYGDEDDHEPKPSVGVDAKRESGETDPGAEVASEAFVQASDENDIDSSCLVHESPWAERVPPCADPPTGPFDSTDLDAWDWLHSTFAAVVTKLDAELGALFDALRERGFDQSAAWLLTSDFGHPLGEHGQVGLHRPWLYEELVHLPLILRLPRGAQPGRRVSGFTQPPDLFPTLLTLLGVAPPAGTAGFDLLPLARGEAESRRDCAVTRFELGDAAEIALRTSEWALLAPTKVPEGDAPREPQLYEKPDDRWEVNDLRPRNVDRADELEARLRAELKTL